jgi:hypothetical protein
LGQREVVIAEDSERPEVAAIQKTQNSTMTNNDPLAFERLISEISAAFVAVPADAIDARIEATLKQVAEFLEADRARWASVCPRTGCRSHTRGPGPGSKSPPCGT